MSENVLQIFGNLVGGRKINLSSQNFKVTSFFDVDYSISIPNSGILDIKTAIAKAQKGEIYAKRLSFDQRKEILNKVSKKIKFSNEEIKSCVKMTGMPITNVTQQLEDISKIFELVPLLIEKRIGVTKGKISRYPIQNNDMFKILHPIDGFTYAVTPGNDPRVTAFICAWLVSLGLSGVFKPAKTDFPIALKTIETIINTGYPSEALNILAWDTSNPNKQKLNFDLVDSASVIWAYGDTETVNNLLRWEIKENGNKVDHFSDKIILKHATGRTSAICDENIDLEKTLELILESSLNWPIGCNALKSIFDVTGKRTDIEPILREKFDNLAKYIGDPMNKKTKIGKINPSIVSIVGQRVDELTRLNQLELLTGKIISENQSTPILLKTHDVHSEFLSVEYPAYLLTLKKCNSYSAAVNEFNISTGKQHRLTAVVFSASEKKGFEEYLHAHHVKRMRHSTELDIMFHEGNDYIHQLARPQIHRL